MKLKTLLLLLIIVLCLTACGDARKRRKTRPRRARQAVQNRIVGGREVPISQRPYVVALLRRGSYHCAGSLITRQHVLTAAHCLYGQSLRDIVVLGNVGDLRSQGIRRSSQRFFIPRNYSPTTRNMDVAVIKMNSTMSGANARPWPLCNHRLTVGTNIQVSGWGTTRENSANFQQRLRTVSIPLVRHARCRRAYRNIASISRTMVCAGGGGNRDACSGDSGGPGIHRGQICAVVSFGLGCARRGSPGVYANVQNRAVKRYIQQAMRS